MNNKEIYRQFCGIEPSLPIFSKDWWLDAVCGDSNWDVVLVHEKGKIVGSMPYYVRSRMGFKFLHMPPLTQNIGPWIQPYEAKYSKVLAYQKRVMTQLIEQLPDFASFQQGWNYSVNNWLPFYWQGFEANIRYTYVIADLINLERVWANLNENIRREVRKSTNRFNLIVREDLNIDAVFDLCKMTFARQKLEIPYSQSLVHRIDIACDKRNLRKVFVAEDQNGIRHAAIYIVWDENSAYYLIGGGNPDYRNSGATSLLMWEAIKYAAVVTKKFDFEGSMLEPIEKYFRAFGAQQYPYYKVYKIQSPILGILKSLSLYLRPHAKR